MTIVWEEPEDNHRPYGGGGWVPIFDELRKHPGKWARVRDDFSTSGVTHFRKGITVGIRYPGEFEARVTTKAGAKRGPLFMRYMPNAEKEARL